MCRPFNQDWSSPQARLPIGDDKTYDFKHLLDKSCTLSSCLKFSDNCSRSRLDKFTIRMDIYNMIVENVATSFQTFPTIHFHGRWLAAGSLGRASGVLAFGSL